MLQRVYTRVSKPAARYSDRGSAAEHCSACRFFMSGGDCARVLGRVLPQGWCKYFSQEAVQRWNPLWPMAGIPAPPGATLDLSFLTSGALDPRITFTRASTATYTNYAGVMQTAAVNAPRWDYNPATLALQGLLIEEARTNLALNSGDLSQWTVVSVGTAAPVVTAHQAVAPDGTLTAARIDFPIVAGAGVFSVVFQQVTVTAAVYTYSIWLRGAVGGEQLYVGANAGTSINGGRITLSTVWQRYLVTGTLTAAGWFFDIGTDLRDGTQAATPAQTIYAWGAQVEQGAFPTSYIPTTAAAVTRAQDQCIIPPANMGWFASPGGSWFAEFVNQVPTAITTTSPRIIGIHDATGITPLWEGSTGQSSTYDGSNAAYSGVITVGAVSKAASTWAPGTGQVCLNGGAVGVAALTTGFATLATSGVGILGGNPGVVNEAMTGYIRRVRYWPRILSNTEMQQVTT